MASDLMKPVPCEICENSPAKFNCNTCGDALCTTCKAHHLKSKGTRDHTIVPYAEKLNPKYFAQLFCSTHHNHSPKFWCDTCGMPICDVCITKEHRGHHCNNISEILTDKRDAMLGEMKAIRDKTMVEWEGVLDQAKSITVSYLDGISQVEKELLTRGKEMHKQVDAILSNSQQTLQKMKESGLAKLQKQEKHLEDRLQKMRDEVQRYEDRLRDADPNTILQFKESTEESKEETNPPSLETTPVPIFTKGQDDTKVLQNMFGQLAIQNVAQKGTKGQLSTPVTLQESPEINSNDRPAATADSGKTQVPSSQSKTIVTQRSPIPNPSIQSKFRVGLQYPCIACVEGGLAWVKTGYKTLQLVDRKGSVKDTINTSFGFNDLNVTSDGDLLLADRTNSCIKHISRQKTISTLFSTSWEPNCVCCLHNGDMVATFPKNSQVIAYSRGGEIRQKMDHIKFRHPMSVAENKVNQDIHVCDHQYHGYNAPGKVVTIGADGKVRYEYTGQDDGKVFAPADVCTDQMGHVLITDFNNNRVHILDQEGQFIQYVLTSQQGMDYPTTIDVDREGYVWMGQYHGLC